MGRKLETNDWPVRAALTLVFWSRGQGGVVFISPWNERRPKPNAASSIRGTAIFSRRDFVRPLRCTEHDLQRTRRCPRHPLCRAGAGKSSRGGSQEGAPAGHGIRETAAGWLERLLTCGSGQRPARAQRVVAGSRFSSAIRDLHSTADPKVGSAFRTVGMNEVPNVGSPLFASRSSGTVGNERGR